MLRKHDRRPAAKTNRQISETTSYACFHKVNNLTSIPSSSDWPNAHHRSCHCHPGNHSQAKSPRAGSSPSPKGAGSACPAGWTVAFPNLLSDKELQSGEKDFSRETSFESNFCALFLFIV
jgi:hypothetical protein